jgi:hypothetical protein
MRARRERAANSDQVEAAQGRWLTGAPGARSPDRYRHLLEGHEAEMREQFDTYLARADTAARLAQLEEVES